MFTSQYWKEVDALLSEHKVERHGPAALRLEGTNDVLYAVWEPGDMTRYTAMVAKTPMDNRFLQVSGVMLNLPFVMQGQEGGFLSTGYFLEKNPHLVGKLNQYTVGKLCQLVGALMCKEAPGDPVDD